MNNDEREHLIFNPHNLKEGQVVILDEGKVTESEVQITWMTPLKMYSIVCLKVEDKKTSWRVMTMRLTPKKNGSE